ncbi:MAG TPA: DMT family transporter [Thermoanaerobaculia bacterium]|nr:DMT family transporter [Thermoanaerobaculia bacterium]
MSSNVKGGAIMLLAVGSFALMDAGMKVLSSAYPPLQIAALRCLSSLPLIVVWVGFRGGFRQLLRVRFGFHAVRAALGVVTLVTFIYGLGRLPLSEAYAIFFIAPLLITIFAALILGERIEWQRWAAIAIGLTGVLIVLRPTGTGVVTLAGLAVVICAVGYALSAILVRILGRTDSTESMVFWVIALMTVGATLLALPQWRPIQPQHWIAIVVIGLSGCLGQWALTEAFRVGEASFIAPFEYSALAWGLALDWMFWRVLPEAHALAGGAVIIASGIYLIRRERSAQTVAAPDAVCE